MVTITVSGPGMCICHEMSAIKSLFEGLGMQVNIVDKHPPIHYNFDSEVYKGRLFKEPITLVAEHQPWGG